jgi:hypothetical protein
MKEGSSQSHCGPHASTFGPHSGSELCSSVHCNGWTQFPPPGKCCWLQGSRNLARRHSKMTICRHVLTAWVNYRPHLADFRDNKPVRRLSINLFLIWLFLFINPKRKFSDKKERSGESNTVVGILLEYAIYLQQLYTSIFIHFDEIDKVKTEMRIYILVNFDK